MIIFNINEFYNKISGSFYECSIFFVIWFIFMSFNTGLVRLLIKDIATAIVSIKKDI